MKSSMVMNAVVGCAVWAACVAIASAAITIDLVEVGNPGNNGEWAGEAAGTPAYGRSRICGAVDYEYRIGTYEVTAQQYTAFLNAVAKTDTYGLYSTSMASHYSNRCGINREGSEGSYQYTVAPGYEQLPVSHVSFGDAMRFANWLHNGQPEGAQGPGTTERGAYQLDGKTSDNDLKGLSRTDDATWAIPNEDEWYKAAYYDPDADAYYDYATGTDDQPASHPYYDPDNSATYYNDWGPGPQDAGWHGDPSPYGTYDQSGNVNEWLEATYDSAQMARGGSWNNFPDKMLAAQRNIVNQQPSYEDSNYGFRVVAVPEPATVGVLGLGGLLLLRRRRQA
jgi:formylglycine-generating enzyme required for sulfatase activity